jgi:pilus assembly protein CpaC
VGGASVAVTIQFRDFGAILQFLPMILANDVIRLDVEPSFSELNPATGVTVLGTTVPGINQRSARTVVELREGQTLALAGLLQTRSTASTTRVPILGDLPVVGALFSSNNILNTETELVVLVTPELVAPMEKTEVPPSPGDRVLEPNDLEFYFLGRIEGKTGHTHRATVAEFDPCDVMRHYQCETNWVVGPHGHSD